MSQSLGEFDHPQLLGVIPDLMHCSLCLSSQPLEVERGHTDE